jgi:hypothetical protein
MFTSIRDVPRDPQNEAVPESSPPWVWIGFIFMAFSLTLEVATLFINDRLIPLELQLITLAGWIYWMVCIYRIHKILNQLTHNLYPYSPGEAVGKHFIPFYNVYWMFKWPSELARYINARGRVHMIPGSVIGTMILLGMMVRIGDAAIGWGVIFGVTMYISNTISRHVDAIKGISPDRLPPLLDPKIFREPIESSPAPEVVTGNQPVKPS